MNKIEEAELKDLCNRAYKFAKDIAETYASTKIVDDFETFMYLMYMIEVRKLEIEKLEERIHELEQKEKAHNNA